MQTNFRAGRLVALLLVTASLSAFAPRSRAQTTATWGLLHSFSGSDGFAPTGLVYATDGNFYSTTSNGGSAYPASNCYGTFFRITPTGTLTNLHDFVNGDGSFPFYAPVLALDGNFYGTTTYGGAINNSNPKGSGTIYRVTTGGALTSLYYFSGGADGNNPVGSLTQGSGGNLYGTAPAGGANGNGTLFRITTGGTFTVLHSFNGDDGSAPQVPPIQASDGNFYGTTASGGSNNDGTIYRYTSDGVLTTLHSFSGSDGSGAYTALIQASDGDLYSATSNGGANGDGTIFKSTLDGVSSTLHHFSASDGVDPQSIIQGADGNFYGTTYRGGGYGYGTFYQLTSGGVFTVLYTWKDGNDGGNPGQAIIQTTPDTFWGGTRNTNVSFGTLYYLVVHPGGALQFSASAYHVNEQEGTAFITVNRAYHGSGAVSIRYATADGTAKARTDYQSASGTLSWADGDLSSRTFPVTIIDRGLYDGSTRTLSLLLSSPTGGADPGNPTTASLTITENDPPPPVLSSGAPPNGRVGSSYSFQVTATNHPTSFAASGLPPGLAIDDTDGQISGTPSQAGTFTVSFLATNATGTGSATSDALTILPAKPVITSPGGASGQVGQPFSYQIIGTNNPTSFSVGNLGDGLTVNASTGLITGTPAAAESVSLTLNASNSGGTGTATLKVTITTAPPSAVPQITSAASDTAQVGQAYEYTIVATNHPTGFASNPSPPCPGLTLNPSTGIISGTPTTAGKFTPALTASNSNGAGPTASFTLNISAAPDDIYGFNFASPPSQSQFVSGIAIPIYVQVLYSPGTLVSVELFADDSTAGTSSKIGASNASINAFNWQPMATTEDAYTLRAVATDTMGVAKTFTLPVTVVPPPSANPVSTIQLLPDVSDKTFIPGSSVTFVPVAGTADSAIEMVGVYDTRGNLIGQSTTPQFTKTTHRIFRPIHYPVKATLATLTATVKYANNCSNPSTAAYLYPSTQPVDQTSLTCAITTPGVDANGAASVPADKPLTLTASARRKNGGSASSVEYYVDGVSAGASTSAPFSVTVPTSMLAAGQHTLTAIATDAAVPVSVQAAPVALTAEQSPAITSATTAAATTGKAFSYQISASNSPTKYGESGLPSGLSIDQSTGKISGTPAAAGTYTVTIAAFNAAGSGSAKLTLTVKVGSPMITSATTASATVGGAFSYQITATNSPTKYGESGLPSGLSINQSTGKISGAPTKSGTYTVTIAAFNAAGSGSAKLTLTVKESPPAITSSLNPPSRQGVAFAYQITATNSPAKYGESGLPAGLAINQSTGRISGTPTKAGTYTVTIAAFNAGGSGSAKMTLVVKPPA